MAETNPNGANQYQLDPRQKLCWDLYVNPKSETFGNGLQSAIKAGYEPEWADRITTAGWFVEKRRRMNLLSKAEKVLDETLEMDDSTPILVGGKPVEVNGEILKVRDASLTKIKQDTAKFVASTQGKHEGYSTKTETDITSKGEQLQGAVFKIVKPE